jgi:hypothetical protein
VTENLNCAIQERIDLSVMTIVKFNPPLPCYNYLDAMRQANDEASRRLGEHMLVSWYDRDRDFESPQHASECHEACAVPGYIDYVLNHGATLMVEIEDGRFVFFYLPLDR